MRRNIPLPVFGIIMILMGLIIQASILGMFVLPKLEKLDGIFIEQILHSDINGRSLLKSYIPDWKPVTPGEYRDFFISQPEPYTVKEYHRKNYVVLESGEIFSFTNVYKQIAFILQNMIFISFILTILGFSFTIRIFIRNYHRPILYLNEFIKNQIYNLNNQIPDFINYEKGQLKTVIRGLKEVIEELKVRNDLLLEQSNNFHKLSTTDGLTGLKNRFALNKKCEEWKDQINSGENFSYILMDIDFFKQYNDTYGHLKGDEALQTISTVFSRVLYSPNDFWARYGGEEFAVILKNTHLGIAMKAAERIRDSIEKLHIPHETSKVSSFLTCSIGIASNIPGIFTELTAMQQKADDALYLSKHNGRNRVTALTCYNKLAIVQNLEAV